MPASGAFSRTFTPGAGGSGAQEGSHTPNRRFVTRFGGESVHVISVVVLQLLSAPISNPCRTVFFRLHLKYATCQNCQESSFGTPKQ
eukprot:1654789-Amphidinium_carterae.1